MMLRMAGMATMGMAFTAGVGLGLALGAGAVGAALLARRMMEERNAWRDPGGTPPLDASLDRMPAAPMGEPGPDAPSA